MKRTVPPRPLDAWRRPRTPRRAQRALLTRRDLRRVRTLERTVARLLGVSNRDVQVRPGGVKAGTPTIVNVWVWGTARGSWEPHTHREGVTFHDALVAELDHVRVQTRGTLPRHGHRSFGTPASVRDV